MNRKFICIMVVCITSLSCMTACKNEDKSMTESERRAMIVSEYNEMTDESRSQVAQAKQVAEKYGEQLLGLYLFNITTPELKEIFMEYNNELIATDDASELSNLGTFYDIVNKGVPYDTYDKYLYDFAKRKNITVAEIRDKVQEWSMLPEEEQSLTLGTEEDYGAFALYGAAVAEHDFFVNIGANSATEVYLFVGANTQHLSVFVTWQDGKILDVTRMYNG